MRVSLSDPGAPEGRARVPARREGVLEADGVFSSFGQGRLWASETIRRLPDEDAIPPSAGFHRRRRSTDADDSDLAAYFML